MHDIEGTHCRSRWGYFVRTGSSTDEMWGPDNFQCLPTLSTHSVTLTYRTSIGEIRKRTASTRHVWWWPSISVYGDPNKWGRHIPVRTPPCICNFSSIDSQNRLSPSPVGLCRSVPIYIFMCVCVSVLRHFVTITDTMKCENILYGLINKTTSPVFQRINYGYCRQCNAAKRFGWQF